jgi:putative membrane protein
MKKLIYPVLGLAIAFSVQSCDNWKAKYLDEKSLVDEPGMEFLQGSMEGGMTEIAASKLAVANSTNQDVVSFAKMMIEDHSKADSAIKAIKFDQLVTSKDSISGEHKVILDSLATKKGADFDKAYMAMMVKDHEGAVDLFIDGSTDKNIPIHYFAEKTLPTVKEHLEKAEELEKTLK